MGATIEGTSDEDLMNKLEMHNEKEHPEMARSTHTEKEKAMKE